MRAKEFLDDYAVDDLNVFGRHEEHYSLDDLMEEYAKIYHESEVKKLRLSAVFLILSGEGGHQTEHQFVMELNTLEEAHEHFDELKKGEFDGTYLYIYEAIKLREE